MSLIITGKSSNVTTPLTRTVSSIASGTAGVWRVQTSVPHLFGDQDYVQLSVTISAVLTAAAGFITVIDSTHFDVAGTTYTATGTGTATDLSLTPQIQVPTDGDPFSPQISGMLSALQALADRTQAVRYEQIKPSTTTITGVAGSSVAAAAAGVPTFFTPPFQAIENDLATIVSGTWATSATITFAAGGSWAAQAGSFTTWLGRTRFSPRVPLSDANHTVGVQSSSGVTGGKTFSLAYPSTNRTITLKSTSPDIPAEAETLTFVLPLAFSGPTWTITLQREDTTVVAVFTPDTAVPIDTVLVAEVEFVSGVWRLGSSTGIWNNAGTFYGVLAGPGA